MADTVLREVADGVATLTLNRPDRLNAITPELVGDFDAALAAALADDAACVIRLRGAGRAFCAGYDIAFGSEWMEEREGGRPWDPMADLRHRALRADLHRSLARPQAGDRAGPRLLRRRRHGLRAVLGSHRLRRGLPDRLPAGPGLGLADDRDVDERGRRPNRRARVEVLRSAIRSTRSEA